MPSMIPWLLRAALAALLLLGAEVILWPAPTAHTPVDWLLRAAGYGALAALLLDWAVRYRLRDIFGVLLLAGAYGLGAALLFAPGAALADAAHLLVTLALGAYTLLGFTALVLWLVLIGGAAGRLTIAGAALTGLAWGVWVRWSPADAGFITLLVYGAGGVLLAGVLLWAARRSATSAAPDSLRLSLAGWAGVLLVTGGILALRVNSGAIDPLLLTITGGLVLFAWVILWFQASPRGQILLSAALPPRTLAGRAALMAAGLFLLMGAVGYHLPFAADGQQRDVIHALLTTFGLVWLPTVSLVLGVRTYHRETRQRRL